MSAPDIAILMEPTSPAFTIIARLRHLHPWAPEMTTLAVLAALGIQCVRRRFPLIGLVQAAAGFGILFATEPALLWLKKVCTP